MHDKMLINNGLVRFRAGTTYLLVEGMPPSYIFKYSELSGFLYDFIVWVPASLVFNENLMKAWLNRFVIAGSRYIIKIY